VGDGWGIFTCATAETAKKQQAIANVIFFILGGFSVVNKTVL
jgi:hypothetical protein